MSFSVLTESPLWRPLYFHQYGNVIVIRDDTVPGGTKARFAHLLFRHYDHLVYATPAEGGAQTALSLAARALGKRATFFVAKRGDRHPRTVLSRDLGAEVIEVPTGYLSNLRSKAERYVTERKLFFSEKVHHLAFGLESSIVIEFIAEVAKGISPAPQEIWFAAGSGTLARGIGRAWPDVPRYAVQVGHHLTTPDVAGATIITAPMKFGDRDEREMPFPSDYHYDAKAFHACLEHTADRNHPVHFWNVAAPAELYLGKSFDDIISATY